MNQPYFIPVTSSILIQITADLAQQIWREHFTDIIGPEQVDYMLETIQSTAAMHRQIQEGMLYYLIQGETRPVGYLAVLPEPQHNKLFLSKLYLLKECRGHGLARTALAFIESLALEMGLSRITLTCNKNNTLALDAYQHLGFATIDTMIKDIGQGFIMDDYILEKTIPSKG